MKVFLSYHSRDKKFVDSLAESLIRFGHEPIVVENNIQAGGNITEKVIKALEEFDVFIPIITKNSYNSEWVNQEIGFAVSRTHSYNSSLVYQNPQSGYIFPIYQEGIGTKLKGFLVNIEGIKFNPLSPKITIFIVAQWLNNINTYNYNSSFIQRCPNCKKTLNIPNPSINGLIEIIEREQEYYQLCSICNTFLVFDPRTLFLNHHKVLTKEEYENAFQLINDQQSLIL